MIIGTYYAIRLKGTKKYLEKPVNGGAGRRGITRSEPVATDRPELYANERAAQLALKVWLKGSAYVEQEFNATTGYAEDRELKFHEVPTRKASRMEIVPVELVVS